MMREVKEPEVRKAEIIQSAKKLFLQKGYLQVTTQDIVNDLKISRGLLYYHFKSKEDILRHIIAAESAAVEQKLKAAACDPALSATDKVERFIFATIIPPSADTMENRALQESLRLPENTYMTDQLYRSMSEIMAKYFACILIQGNEEGVFHVNNPEETAVFLMTAFLFTLNSRDFMVNDPTVAAHYLTVFNEILNRVTGAVIKLPEFN